MPEKNYPTPVKWEGRGNGTAWISVGYPDRGRHFQCDYYGDMEEGPKTTMDFAYDPPDWVVEALGLVDFRIAEKEPAR